MNVSHIVAAVIFATGAAVGLNGPLRAPTPDLSGAGNALTGDEAEVAWASYRRTHSSKLTNLVTLNSAAPVAMLTRVNEYADNPDKVVDRRLADKFRGIGMIQRERELLEDSRTLSGDRRAQAIAGHGSGVNIGPCAVLTNYHVAFGEDYPPVKGRDYKMLFNIGNPISGAFPAPAILTPKVWGGPSGYVGNSKHKDFVVSKDSSCSGMIYGWYDASNMATEELVSTHQRVMVVSFPGHHGKDNLAVSFGRVTGINPVSGDVLYDASTSEGSSGGAVFIIDDNGQLLLQGIHVAGAKPGPGQDRFATYTTEHANEFLNVMDILYYSELDKFLKIDLREHPSPNSLRPLLHFGR